MKNTRLILQLIFLLFIITLFGCIRRQTPNELPTQTKQILTSSIAMIYTPTVFNGSKITPTLNRTITATEKPTISDTSTQIYFPTQSPEQVDSSILELFKNNGGCLFPCWWGITPGVTNWDEGLKFLSPLASKISSRQNDDGIIATIYFNQTPNGIDPFVFDIKVREGIIQDIFITSSGSIGIPFYDLTEILKTYGKPDEIWVDAYGLPCDNGNGQRLVTLRLFYKNIGVLIQYDFWGEANHSTISACIDSNPIIYLWSPDLNLDYAITLQNAGLQVGDNPSLSVEKAFGMDIEEFYQKYSNNSTSCTETPRELWDWCDTTPTP